jgi:GDSL-like Lipase/Acylhydrolase family
MLRRTTQHFGKEVSNIIRRVAMLRSISDTIHGFLQRSHKDYRDNFRVSLIGNPRKGKVMRRATRSVYLLLFATSLTALLAVSSGTASAASDYDDLLRVSPTLYVYTDGATKTQTMDVSATWWAEFKQSYDKRVAQNIGWPTNFATEFDDIMAFGGSWGVFMRETSDGNLVSIVGTRDPNAYCGFVGSASSGSYQCASNSGYGFVRADYFTHSSFGGNGCIGSYGNRCSDTGMNIYDSPIVFSDTAGYTFVSIPNSTLSSYHFFFMKFDLNYPSGYEGKLIPTEPPLARYVAMGDSFSSGEGNAPFEAGTDTSSNTCHRSPRAYPRLLQNDLDLGPTAFVACSGAVSDYIINDYNQENVEPPQAAHVSSDTRLITISIGGNDVGFGNVLTTCTMSTEREGTTEEKHQIEHDACIEAIDDARDIATSATLQHKLETVFSGLRSLGNQDLHVVVVGYPNLLPAYSDIVGSCVWGNGYLQTSGRSVAGDEVQKSRLLHNELNMAIKKAVDATNDNQIHFVDPSSAFVGHELCRPDPWFNNVVPDAFDNVMRRMSYHPNESGQIAYAAAVETEVNNILP